MIIIGEKINGTIETVRRAVDARDSGRISGLAAAQAEAGADYIDVNVATGTGDEADAMHWALSAVREATCLPVALDSADPSVLAAALSELGGGDSPPFINSVSGEESKLSSILPLAAEHGCPLVALAMDEKGIPDTAAARLEVCRRIIERAESARIPREKVFLDPLVLPVSADCAQGSVTLETLRLIRSELPGASTVMGLSNVSFGLPTRALVNRAMMAMAVAAGLDAAIIDPTDRELVAAAYAAESVAGLDRHCRRYMKAFRGGLFGQEATRG